MLDVEDGLVEQLRDMSVMKRVEDLLAATLPDHQPEMPQAAQLVRDGRGLHAHRVGHHSYRAGARLEVAEDLDPRGRRQHLHALGNDTSKLSVDRRRSGVSLNSVAHKNT